MGVTIQQHNAQVYVHVDTQAVAVTAFDAVDTITATATVTVAVADVIAKTIFHHTIQNLFSLCNYKHLIAVSFDALWHVAYIYSYL